MSKHGCVLTDGQLEELLQYIKIAGEEGFFLDLHREDIVSALYELQKRRAIPDLPDADDLLGIEADAQEAIDDALADTRPTIPYEQREAPDDWEYYNPLVPGDF